MADDSNIQAGMEKFAFYEGEPKMGDIVMVQVVRLEDNSIKVRLLEYKCREAMLPHTELTNVRIRSIAQTIQVGQIQPMEVLRVDTAQGYVDVSKKKVKKEDAKLCKDKYEAAKQVHRILLRTAALTNVPFERLQASIAFPAYRKYGHAMVLFKTAATDPSILDAYVAEFPPSVKEQLVAQVQHSLKLKEVIVQAKVNATCFSHHGADGLRTALLKTQEFGEAVEPKMKLLVHLTACPEYLLQVKTDDKVAGRQKLHDAIALLTKELSALGGDVSCKEEPTVIDNGRGDKRSLNTISAISNANEEEDDE